MKKLVKSSEEAREKFKSGLRLITEPVIQTLSPKGRNVIYEDGNGSLSLTNDGVTIAKQVTSDDPVENSIIEIVKHGALKTNSVAGDGTTTTVLFSSILINEGWKRLDSGVNPMVLKKNLEDMAVVFLKKLTPIQIENDTDLMNIATISANSDSDIAKNVVDVVNTAGQDGIVVIEDSNKQDTVVEKNSGFIVESGIFSPEYAQNNGFTATYENCHVMITDKRIYYREEVETIIRTAVEAGIKNLVIVAKDYIGKAVNAFSHNQVNNDLINLLLIKTTDENALSDLAVYLDGRLISDKHGKLVDKMTADDFVEADRVYANPHRTVITATKEQSTELKNLIASLKEAKEEDEEDKDISKRLASLTSGMVTVKVGGSTPIEVREKIYRYEDAINATRSALKDGYLVGGGLAMLNAYDDDFPEETKDIAKRLSQASIRQIAKNCGAHEDYIISGCSSDFGYNAKEDAFANLLDAGVIDPYKVTEMAIRNAVSVANSVLTAGWVIVNQKEKKKYEESRTSE